MGIGVRGQVGRTLMVPTSKYPVDKESRRSLIRLLTVVAAVLLAALATGTTDWLEVVVGLILMVMLHELGHFATAKWSGMKVTEYFLGFGPKIWSFRKGETEYGVKAIPAGGYVKIVGMSNVEEVDPVDEPRTYRQQPFHNRLIVALAGSFMHFVMAFILLWTIFSFYGMPDSRVLQVGSTLAFPGGAAPAQAAGVRPGDVLISVDGVGVTQSNLSTLIDHSGGSPVKLVLKRAGKVFSLDVKPVSVPATDLHRSGTSMFAIGVQMQAGLVTENPIAAIGTSAKQIVSITSSSIAAVGHRFSPSGLNGYFHIVTSSQAARTAAQNGSRPTSIVGAAVLLSDGARAGYVAFAEVLNSINVFVALLNLLPMLPLDGGHVVVAIYERIRTRKDRAYHADVTKLTPIAYLFVMFLAVIVLSALFLDIAHPLANPFK